MKFTLTSFLCTAFLLINIVGHSQVHQRQELLWLRYYGSYEISDKWIVKAEFEYRSFQPNFRPHQLLTPRLHFERKISDQFNAGVGGVYFLHWLPHDPEITEEVMRKEFRPHQYLKFKKRFSWGIFKQRWMIEQRWRQNIQEDVALESYRFNFRFRYRFSLDVFLNESKKWDLTVGAEPMINMGRSINEDYFDQSRLFVGSNYKISEGLKLQLTYVNWYQPVSRRNVVYLRDIVRFTVFHQF